MHHHRLTFCRLYSSECFMILNQVIKQHSLCASTWRLNLVLRKRIDFVCSICFLVFTTSARQDFPKSSFGALLRFRYLAIQLDPFPISLLNVFRSFAFSDFCSAFHSPSQFRISFTISIPHFVHHSSCSPSQFHRHPGCSVNYHSICIKYLAKNLSRPVLDHLRRSGSRSTHDSTLLALLIWPLELMQST